MAHDCGLVINPDGLQPRSKATSCRAQPHALGGSAVRSQERDQRRLADLSDPRHHRDRRKPIDIVLVNQPDRRRPAPARPDPSGRRGDRQRDLRRHRRAHPPRAVHARSRASLNVVRHRCYNLIPGRPGNGPAFFIACRTGSSRTLIADLCRSWLFAPRYQENQREEQAREAGGSGGNRRRMGRRHARGDAGAHGAGRQAAPLRHPPRPACRGEGALQAGDRDARLPGHHQQRQHLGRLHLDHAGIQPLSDLPRLPAQRQERDAGKADRAGTVGGRRADHARQAQQPEIHHRLFAALQHQDRLRQEEDRRWHARQGRLRAGQPASLAQRSAPRSQAACGSRRW